MKVLMLGWELPPHNSGGLGTACFQLCKALSKQNVDIEFILPYSANHDNVDFMNVRAAVPGGITSVLKPGKGSEGSTAAGAYDSRFYNDGSDLDTFGQQKSYEEGVGRIAGSAEFDIIHAHDWLTCRAALRAKMVSGKPLILHFHSIESDRAGKHHGGNPMIREIEGLSCLLADRIIAVSQLTKDGIVREYGIPADKIDVVHNSLDHDMYEPLDANNVHSYLELMRGQGYRVVNYVGRITIQKGLSNLIRAAKEVVERQPKTLFLIVGAGEQLYELINLAADLGISKNVIFTGFQRGKNLRDSLAIGDLFVMPSVSEPFGLTPLEAIGYGTPALISKQSGVSEVFRNALKVDFWDVNEMANKIVGVMQNDILRDELQKNAFNEHQSLSWDSAAERLKDWYTQHISNMVEVAS